SGVAPGAVVASNKALWTSVNEQQSGGVVIDLVDAVEAAVTDGVDVLNYSVGSTSESGLDAPVEQAFLAAAAAGVFVATSAGNSGPTAATLDHPSPWVTTVAASTMAPRNHAAKPVYPQIAEFSSRGPSVADRGDLIKPDLAAPGVDVLAALAPRRSSGPRFGYLSGTSMAAPQVAGLAALYLGRYPSTGPMAVKSALMTTAAPTRTSSGSASTNAYAQGSGVVRADRMLTPPVVVDSGLADWQGYLEAHGVATGSGLAAVDPSDFNAPSIAVGRLAGSRSVTRRLTSTRAGRVTLAAAVPGFDVATSPSRMTFTAAGQTRTVRVTFTRTTAPLLRPAFGSLTVRGATATSRLPVALTPSLLDAPTEVAATGASGSRTLTLRSGVAGELTTTAYGLARGHVTRGSVGVRDSGTPVRSSVPVPRGTRVVRLSLAADEPDADIDLYVYAEVDGEMSLVAESAGLSGREELTLPAPEAGSYVVEVVPAADPPGQPGTGYALTSYLVGPTADSLRVTPSRHTTVPGRPFSVEVSWSGLAPGSYLGSLAYAGPRPAPHGTLVQVQVD
ncbi:MAG: Peptidase inhibitor, partial [Friedmanniella sp.]|nr:Peptidase inhibitor [Friedmanniella sp.]